MTETPLPYLSGIFRLDPWSDLDYWLEPAIFLWDNAKLTIKVKYLLLPNGSGTVVPIRMVV
jgi:hypothetical protein